MAESYAIPLASVPGWLDSLARKTELFAPTVVQDRVHWRRVTPGSGLDPAVLAAALRRIRAAEPVKGFFFSPREQVATFPDKLDPPVPGRRVLFGLKGCDLLPLLVHEQMFLTGEFADPFYAERLKSTVLVAADCPEPEDSCFCSLVGRRPFADDGADATVAVLEDVLVVQPLTPRGEELLSGTDAKPATQSQLAERQRQRESAVKRLDQVNSQPWPAEPAQRLARRGSDEAFWKKHASTCVECYGCLMACPTCYCYLLYDKAAADGVDRTKVWDACYIAAYQRVGGGANPRVDFLKRFANRFQCKFQHFKNKHGFYACSGCGRCLRTCMGKIDLRKVIAEA